MGGDGGLDVKVVGFRGGKVGVGEEAEGWNDGSLNK